MEGLMGPNSRIRGRRSKENGDVSQSSLADELDPWTAWAYKPRTISMLLIGACFLIWASGALDPESTICGDVVISVKRGVWAMIAVFLAYCLLQAPSTYDSAEYISQDKEGRNGYPEIKVQAAFAGVTKILIRPHPAIWRLVHGMAVIYLVVVTFLLFQ